MSNVDAARTGDRRAALIELRDTLALALDEGSSGIAAQVAAQYRATLIELEELAPAVTLSKADELKARRAKRSA